MQKRTFFETLGLLFNTLMPTTSILILIERIYRYQIKQNYPKNRQFIFFAFLKLKLNFECFAKKNEPHNSSISEVIESERCACLSA